jgi:hypothetical protein
MPQREASKTRGQGIVLSIVWYAKGSLEIDCKFCIGIDFGESEHQGIMLEL